MSLDAHLVVRRGGFELDCALAVPDGRVLGVLGPNGSGKTTVLRALAGLLPLRGGHVTLAGEDLAGVPPERRRTGVVFQDYLLFPHLSALDNVAFGLRATGTPRRRALEQARGWLERMSLAELGGARPRALSGGQAQRVALARALVTRPQLLLLDEPLSALDAGTRMQVRTDLRRHLREFAGCTLLVTHDPLDAMVLADSLVVVEQGRVVQVGPPAEVARAPRTEYVAHLVGLNLYRGNAAGGRVNLHGGGELTSAGTCDGPVFVSLRPSAVGLHRTPPEGSARNTWPGRVARMEQHGDTVRIEVEGAPRVLADVTPAAVAELDLSVGAPVWVSVKATELHVEAA